MPRAGGKVKATDNTSLDRVLEPSDSATITTTETVVATLTFDATNGDTYTTEWNLKVQQSVAGDFFLFTVREDNLSGTQIDQWAFSSGTATYGVMRNFVIPWTAASTGPKTIVGTLVRGSGTGNVKRAAKSNYRVYRED